MHAYAHPKVVSEREKNELDTQKKRGPRTGSAQSVSSPPSVPAHHSDEIRYSSRLYTSLPFKRLAVPFCIIARAIRRNEKQRVTRYKTKPLFFSLGTCRLSDSCSARVTLARVSSSCARDGEISTHFGNYFDLHHRLQTRARETREVCLIRSDRREKKKLTFSHKRKPLLTFPLKRIRI